MDATGGVRRAPAVLIAVFILALVVRLGAIALLDSPICCDADDYIRHAESIAAGEGYPPSGLSDGGPTILRPPLYPSFIGAGLAAVDDLRAVKAAQAVAGAVAAALIGLLAWQILGTRRHALVAGVLAAIYPAFVLEANTFLSESLFVPLEIATICGAWHLRRVATRTTAWAAGIGALVGLAMLTRQTGALLLLPVTVALLLVAHRPLSVRLRQLAVVSLASLAVVAPWTVRNHLATGHFVLVGRQTGIQLAGVYNDDARLDPVDPGLWRPSPYVERDEDLFFTAGIDEVELDRELRARAIDYALEHPAYVGEAVARNTLRMLALDDTRFGGYTLSVSEPQADVVHAAWYAACLLGIAGWFTRARRRVPLWIWLTPGAFFVSGATSAALLRYRIPADPFVLLLASAAVVAAFDRGAAWLRPDQARRADDPAQAQG